MTSNIHLPGRVIRTAGQKMRLYALFGILGVAAWFLMLLELPDPVAGWALVLAGSGLLLYIVLRIRAVGRFNLDMKPGLESLARGEMEKAEEVFAALRARRPWQKALRNLARYNLAIAIHRQGRHADAIEALIEAERGGGAVNIDPAIASTFSMFYACLGSLEPAEKWVAEAKRRYAGQVARVAFPDILGEIAVALRRGDFAAVQARLERDWSQIEHTHSGGTLRPIKLLRAFAVAQAAGVRDGSAAAPYVDSLHPVRPAEFAYLATSWPELRDFIATALPSHSAASALAAR